MEKKCNLGEVTLFSIFFKWSDYQGLDLRSEENISKYGDFSAFVIGNPAMHYFSNFRTLYVLHFWYLKL